MKFEFARYTDVTKYAKKYSKDKSFNEYVVYEKILICPDTHDCWVAKIQVGYNEQFEKDPDKVIIERNKLDGMGARWGDITDPMYCREVLRLDIEYGCYWDVIEYDTIEEAIEDLDGGFGIIGEQND